MSGEIESGRFASIEYWPNGSKSTACRAWLHTDGEPEALELDERKLVSQADRSELVTRLGQTLGPEVVTELATLLAKVAVAVLDAQARARHVKEARQSTTSAPTTPESPWESEVDGAALMDEIIAYLERYVVFPSQWALYGVALWVFLTHVHDASDFSPLLIITSPTKGSGKSRVLEVIALLVCRPWINLSPSDAVLYRKIDADHPTLLVDEADNTNWRERAPLVAILNGGFSKATAQVPRCVGEDSEPTDFSVWAPKALAGKGLQGIPDTTRSRSVIIHMKRRRKDTEPVQRFRQRVARREAAPLRAKLIRWGLDHFADLIDSDPKMPESISDRSADAWSPLVAIADALSGRWSQIARDAAGHLSGGEHDALDIGERLLADIRDILEPVDPDTRQPLTKVERIASADLVARLRALEAAPWAEWNKGRGLGSAQLAGLLDQFGIGPKQQRVGERNLRGYALEQFADVFSRNLPPDRYNATAGETKEVRPTQRALRCPVCSTSDSGHKSLNVKECSAVAGHDPEDSDRAGGDRVQDGRHERGDAWEGDGLTIAEDQTGRLFQDESGDILWIPMTVMYTAPSRGGGRRVARREMKRLGIDVTEESAEIALS